MKKTTLFLVGMSFHFLFGQKQSQPKLLIGIVVDQMRYDYIDRFWDDFEEGGFKRLVNHGFSCKNVHYNYKPTYTGPGHASIFTGATPSIHGIVGNNWYDRVQEQTVYCVEVPEESGGSYYSPERLRVGTFSDQIKMMTNEKAKVFGVSLKDRGAILPIGYLGDKAYWFDDKKGEWTSSTYYKKAESEWFLDFNKIDFKKKYMDEDWELSKSMQYYSESWPDETIFENPYIEGGKVSFPYDLKALYADLGYGLLKRIPQGNQMTVDFSKKLIVGEQLGKDSILDFLSISFSATDYIGHQFGTRSVEVHDTYLKLDKSLAMLLSFLDEQLGEEAYLLFLTSDHGAGEPQSFLKQKGIPSGNINSKKVKHELDSILDLQFEKEDWLLASINFNIYYNYEVLKKYNKQEVFDVSKRFLNNYKGIYRVYSSLELGVKNDWFFELTCNGYFKQNSGDILFIEEPNYSNYPEKGSTHGSLYSYDTHVPLLFYGAGIKKGSDYYYHPITEIAATLAAMLNFPKPEGCHENPIVTLVER